MTMGNLFKSSLKGLVILLLGGAITAIIIFNFTGERSSANKESVSQLVDQSYETSELTTDLEDGSFVRIQFQIITDGKKARKEIEQREFQLKNILIKEVSMMNEEDFQSGLGELEKHLKDEINKVMIDGKVTDVYTINKILQ